MGGIERRGIVKAAAAGAVGLSIGGAQSLLTANEADAQGTPVRAWPNKQVLDLLKIDHPIIQAPMGFHTGPDMPIAVSNAGGLGSFPCAPLTPAQVREVVAKIRAHSTKPLNLNFFCHVTQRDGVLETTWLKPSCISSQHPPVVWCGNVRRRCGPETGSRQLPFRVT
jgi:hypothetical protein